jgi:hypothetical protein
MKTSGRWTIRKHATSCATPGQTRKRGTRPLIGRSAILRRLTAVGRGLITSKIEACEAARCERL